MQQVAVRGIPGADEIREGQQEEEGSAKSECAGGAVDAGSIAVHER